MAQPAIRCWRVCDDIPVCPFPQEAEQMKRQRNEASRSRQTSAASSSSSSGGPPAAAGAGPSVPLLSGPPPQLPTPAASSTAAPPAAASRSAAGQYSLLQSLSQCALVYCLTCVLSAYCILAMIATQKLTHVTLVFYSYCSLQLYLIF